MTRTGSGLGAATRAVLAGALALAGIAAPAEAQRTSPAAHPPRTVYVQRGDLADIQNVPYDGRFTFARIRFTPLGEGDNFWRRRDRKWDHDTPRAERHFMKILSELSTLRPFMDGGNILTLDDPELFKYPIAYLCEPGFWTVTDKEAAGLRDYLDKGGFLIIDDFVADAWYNFASTIAKVLPQSRLIRLDLSQPVFDSFFHIKTLDYTHPYYSGFKSEFYGIFEDNDPKKRLMVVVNYNNDIGEYWEWSDEGMFGIEATNEAYKIGVDYIIYGMTH